MYKILKKALITISIIFLAWLSIWDVSNYKNQMLGGYQKVIAVNQSKIDVLTSIKKIADEYHVTFAKQIPEPLNDDKGGIQNTFIPIGSQPLPSTLILQKNTTIIQNSQNDVLYVLLGDGIEPGEVVKILNDEGNQTAVFNNDWSLNLLLSFLKPTLGVGVLMVLAAFISLLLSEHIANLKSSGIRRLAGVGKARTALKGLWPSLAFIAAGTVIAAALSSIYLLVTGQAIGQALQIVWLTLGVWGGILSLVTVAVSLLAYYALQKQPINLSVKGKIPIRTITVVIIIFQAFSLVGSMYSVSDLSETNYQASLLKKGVNEWAKHKNLFGLSEFGWNSPDGQKLEGFLTEELNQSDTILAYNQFASQTLSDSAGYLPSINSDENILFVNDNFLKQSGIQVDSATQQKIDNLSLGQYVLLIPESQKENDSSIASAWKKAMFSWNGGAKKPLDFKQISATYPDKKELFAYSIKASYEVSNQNFAKSPLLFVYSPKSFAGTKFFKIMFEPMIPQILVTDQNLTRELIAKYGLQSNIGSLRNGYAAILDRAATVGNQQKYAMTTNVLSILSSLLLIALLNTVYLYQNRKKFLIEKLAGKGNLQIHKTYLFVVSAATIVVALVTSIGLHFSALALMVPVLYIALVFALFAFQVYRSNQANAQILKGE